MPISIIIPAHNEEVTIAETIKSLMYLDYRLYEVIVVNDRSTDSTGELVAETFHLHKVMRPIRRQLPCQDPISVFEGTLKKGISITLINKTNGGKADAINMGINAALFPYFICMDADSILQYERSFLASRILLDKFNANLIISGAFGLFKKDAVIQVGSIGEDMDLIMKLHAGAIFSHAFCCS